MTVSHSVLEQPLKIPFIAAIILVVNGRKLELVTDFLRQTGEFVQNYINTGSWREVKLLLRFLGCLQNLFEGEGIFPILEELFARAVDLQTASSEDVSPVFCTNKKSALTDICNSVIRA